MKNSRPLGLDRRSDFNRLVDSYLEKIQEELLPDKTQMIVAINLDTGEYVLGNDAGEASRLFQKKWPNAGFHMCRVNGTPAIRM